MRSLQSLRAGTDSVHDEQLSAVNLLELVQSLMSPTAGCLTTSRHMKYHGWINELASEIGVRLLPIDFPPPLGCHVFDEDGLVELTLFFGATETMGGELDGCHRSARFHFDLLGVTELFDDVQSFFWQPLTIDTEDDLGPHVSIEGTYQGNQVWVRVLSRPPENVSAGVIANTYTGEFVQRW